MRKFIPLSGSSRVYNVTKAFKAAGNIPCVRGRSECGRYEGSFREVDVIFMNADGTWPPKPYAQRFENNPQIDFQVGARVTVHSFGVHPGKIVEHDPILTIQGRRQRATGLVRVMLDNGREWSGATHHLSLVQEAA